MEHIYTLIYGLIFIATGCLLFHFFASRTARACEFKYNVLKMDSERAMRELFVTLQPQELIYYDRLPSITRMALSFKPIKYSRWFNTEEIIILTGEVNSNYTLKELLKIIK